MRITVEQDDRGSIIVNVGRARIDLTQEAIELSHWRNRALAAEATVRAVETYLKVHPQPLDAIRRELRGGP